MRICKIIVLSWFFVMSGVYAQDYRVNHAPEFSWFSSLYDEDGFTGETVNFENYHFEQVVTVGEPRYRRYLKTEKFESFRPEFSISSPIFLGDYLNKKVKSITAEFRTFYHSPWNLRGRPIALLLSHKTSEGETWILELISDNVPLPEKDEWKEYIVNIPAIDDICQSPGTVIVRSGDTGGEVYNCETAQSIAKKILSDVQSVQFWYGKWDEFYPIDSHWELGAGNLSIQKDSM